MSVSSMNSAAGIDHQHGWTYSLARASKLRVAADYVSRRAVLKGMSASAALALIGLDASFAPPANASGVTYALPFPLDVRNKPWSTSHHGYDFGYGGVSRGSAIKAIAAGVVCHVASDPNNLNAHGNRIEVSHADGAFSGYCHMRDAPTLSVGASVTLGQVLGYVGNSGYVAGVTIGNHLHLGMSMTDGGAINGIDTFDPIAYISAPQITNGRANEMMIIVTPNVGAPASQYYKVALFGPLFWVEWTSDGGGMTNEFSQALGFAHVDAGTWSAIKAQSQKVQEVHAQP